MAKKSKKLTKKTKATKAVKAIKARSVSAVKKTGKKARTMNKKVWSTMLIGGIAAIIVGLIAVFWPGVTIGLLAVVFGIFLIIMGGIWLLNCLSHIKTDKLWWLGGLAGLGAVILGIVSLFNPDGLLDVFRTVLIIFVFAQAIVDLVIASYADSKDKMLWIVIGLVSIVFGFALIINPTDITTVFIFLLGVYALIHGMVATANAITMKKKL